MQKIFVGLLAGAVSGKVIKAVRAMVDFIYYSQFQVHTTRTLAALRQSLSTFHQLKDVFVELGARQHFNIPKFHAILHYYDAIVYLGSLDGYNTESPERLHIDYAKEAYRASNRKDFQEQMTLWLQRQEAIVLRSAYISWRKDNMNAPSDTESDSEDSDIDDDKAMSLSSVAKHHLRVRIGVEPTPTSSTSTTTSAASLSHQMSTITVQPTSHTPRTPTPIFSARYHIAKRAPMRGVTVTQLVTDFGAADFLPSLSLFLRTNFRTYPEPHQYDRFDVFKNIKITLQTHRSQAAGNRDITYTINTTPSIPRKGRKAETPGRFDTALIVEDPCMYNSDRGLQGLHFSSLIIPCLTYCRI
jgi:hypothetical protein